MGDIIMVFCMKKKTSAQLSITTDSAPSVKGN
uniref:Uncharacterized protein n=1 Tax=Anguilla anguilla TaxID=7936 RepID=A0A0E9VRF8_ANGAN